MLACPPLFKDYAATPCLSVAFARLALLNFEKFGGAGAPPVSATDERGGIFYKYSIVKNIHF